MPTAPPDWATGAAVEALRAAGEIDWDQWNDAASRLEQLPMPATADRRRCIHELYLPLLFWLQRKAGQLPRPVVAGISAPQGAGKSTLVKQLVPLLIASGRRACALSIDDFYLPFPDQERLAVVHPRNPCLRYRGYPGTHDVALGAATLKALRECGPGDCVRVPAYDKSLRGGRGDRLPPERWPLLRGPFDIVLLEGWMLGFQPVSSDRIGDAHLLPVNEALRRYDAWHRQIDVLVILRTLDLENIVRWRVEAEEAMKAAGRPGLDRAAAEDYVRRFLPAYRLYAGGVGSGPWAPDRQIELLLDRDRLPERS
jgi:D-glycerate 3-kinase